MDSIQSTLDERYWPGNVTRRTEYMFDEDVFLFYRLLINNNSGISQHGFLHSLEQFSFHKGRVSHIMTQSAF